MPAPTILVVDDEPLIRWSLKDRLSREDYRVIEADTAVSGAASGSFPPPTDTGVPFAFQDNNVRNGTTYYYAVTAFDVNAINSGPSSLESDPAVKRARPRVTSSNARAAVMLSPV